MKLPTWLEAVLAIALIVAAVSWYRAHDALRDALAQKDVLVHERADLQAQIDAAGKAELKANNALETERKKPATVQTVMKFIPMPGPIQYVPATPLEPAHIEITGDPQQNLDALQNFGIGCQECRNSLDARNTQYADLQKQLQLSDQNAKNWEKAARKGSGFWFRAREWGIRAGFAAGGYAAGRVMK
jgi:hypothetical protein